MEHVEYVVHTPIEKIQELVDMIFVRIIRSYLKQEDVRFVHHSQGELMLEPVQDKIVILIKS
jgi:hypothetical protein